MRRLGDLIILVRRGKTEKFRALWRKDFYFDFMQVPVQFIVTIYSNDEEKKGIREKRKQSNILKYVVLNKYPAKIIVKRT